jgi:MFS transporter, ACS family, 4-hydroxyphenylacetate permease
MMGQPVAMALGAGVSGMILEHLDGGLGLQGWRWLFLLEGLPAAILGVVAYGYLSDKPAGAGWLDQGEKNTLKSLLADNQGSSGRQPEVAVWKQLTAPRVLLLALAYFCLVNTLNANATWIPTIVREVMTAYSLSQVGFVTAIPAVCALVLMPLWNRNSDRTQERVWHVVAALGLAAAGWLLVIWCPQPALRLVGLVFTVSFGFCAMSTFWTLPQSLLSEAARPAGIALISAVGLLGSAVSPAVIGLLRDATGNFSAGLFYVTGLLAVSIVLVLIVTRPFARA